jgi:hypothetical protein
VKLPAVLATAIVAFAAVAASGSAPDDPHFPQQWGLRKIGAPEAWPMSRGEGDVVPVV